MGRTVKVWHLLVTSIAVLVIAVSAQPEAKAPQRGPQGPQGEQGQQGDPGPQGPRGPKGKPGAAGKDGKDAPTPPVSSASAGGGGSTITDGTWHVGDDVSPGMYRAKGGPSCYFQTSQDANGEEIVDNSFGEKNVVVTLESGQWFQTEGCGDWQ